MSLGCEISTAELLADANNVGAGAIECVSWDSTGFYSRTPPGLVESAACKKTQTLLRMLSIPADNAACEIVMVRGGFKQKRVVKVSTGEISFPRFGASSSIVTHHSSPTKLIQQMSQIHKVIVSKFEDPSKEHPQCFLQSDGRVPPGPMQN
ncbi:hypothetical protein CIHG_09253 [Coccidioides immitis H538.4]|uniref:Uncharacterized protein n=1 Tax=Coccidioides immitis H538.4 TaxID=396776 RepID=A0A0J8S3U3_COCIT|nr:hypothetical protein CIHG_09253 [Coccidioides immitis H538.4]